MCADWFGGGTGACNSGRLSRSVTAKSRFGVCGLRLIRNNFGS